MIFLLFYNKIFAVTFDEDFARAVGTRVEAYNLLIAVVIAVIIVLAMNLVGSLLISALVIFPALSAMRVFRSFKGVTICSAVLSVVCALLGILISILAGTPVGSTIVAVNGKRVEKTGVFTALQDAYYNRTRYYVWGYNDNTRCCDWQWEILPLSTDNLPANGSLVKVQGTFADSEDALDGYWIRSAEIETLTAYTGPTAEVDMAMMSDTLERVQLASVVSYPDQFEGKSYSAYGRIAALNFLEDPYYDNSWQVPYVSEETAPAVGSESLLRGVISAGTLGSATFSKRAE